MITISNQHQTLDQLDALKSLMRPLITKKLGLRAMILSYPEDKS